MIQSETILYVADNSGAKLVSCIKVLGGSKKKYAKIGDIIKISVKKCIPKGKVKKGEVHFAILVRSLKGLRRNDYSYIKFNQNAVVLINNKLEPIGTRIFGPIPREIKLKCFKITSLAHEVL